MAERPAFVVSHPINGSPLAAGIAFQYANIPASSVKFVPKKDASQSELSITAAGVNIKGDFAIASYFAKSSPTALFGKPDDAVAFAKVWEWVPVAAAVTTTDQLMFGVTLAQLDLHLMLRSVLIDYTVTFADILVWAALHKNAYWVKYDEAATYPNVARWYRYLASLPQFQAVVGNSSSAASDASAKKARVTSSRTGTQGSFSGLTLVNATKGNVVTRFPPEPSGYAHIGHCKAALLNQYYAQTYEGRLIIRFDDTNPTKEKDEYVQSILQDLGTIGVKSERISYTSDYFEQLLQFAEQVIKSGKAYIDNTPVEQMRTERMNGIESKCRNQSVEENLRLWREMVSGSEEGLKCVLRGKIDMQEPNKCLRDPALYRCINMAHHRVGGKYKAYPMYDFACPIVDSIEGVTHALRSSEYHDRNPLYDWVVNAVGLRKPCIEDFSRLNFAFTLLSKRKLQWFVDKGLVDGWHDPRFPTIQGILRRGLTVEALKEFILSQGASKTMTLMEPEKLWAINKKIIDPQVARYTVIINKVLVTLTNGPTVEEGKSVPKHRKTPELGNKTITFFHKVYLEREDVLTVKIGEEVTLMNWGNIIVDSIDTAADGTLSVTGRLNPEGDPRDMKFKKLTWASATPHAATVTLVEYDDLITKAKLDEDDNFEDFVNPHSKFAVTALGDPAVRLVQKGERVQFERRGYFICDEAYSDPAKPIVFILIPDGHTSKQQSTLSSIKEIVQGKKQ